MHLFVLKKWHAIRYTCNIEGKNVKKKNNHRICMDRNLRIRKMDKSHYGIQKLDKFHQISVYCFFNCKCWIISKIMAGFLFLSFFLGGGGVGQYDDMLPEKYDFHRARWVK